MSLLSFGAFSQPETSKPDDINIILSKYETIANQLMQKAHVPGMAIAIVKGQKVVYLKGFGVRRAGFNEPVDENTVFQIASVSKPITSTVIAKLVGEKKVDWSTKIHQLTDRFTLSDVWTSQQLTIADLLSHRSGLPDHAGDILEDLGYSRDQIIHKLRFINQLDDFRASFNYTNFGFSEAAYAVSEHFNQSWQELLNEKLLKPLSMRRTSSLNQDFMNHQNRVALHVIKDDKPQALYQRNPDAQAPAGGISSSISDLSQWLIMLINDGRYKNKQIVDAAALSDTHQPHNTFFLPEKPWSDYGYGWNVSRHDNGQVQYGHSGAFVLGVRSVVTVRPDQKMGIIILTNAAITGLPEVLSQTWFDLYDNGQVTKDWYAIINPILVESLTPKKYLEEKPDQTFKPMPLSRYAGLFHNDYFGDIEVSLKNQDLMLAIGPEKKEFKLTHWNRDTFYLETIGEMASGKSPVTFVMDEEGSANSVTIAAFNEFGEGRFTKNN